MSRMVRSSISEGLQCKKWWKGKAIVTHSWYEMCDREMSCCWQKSKKRKRSDSCEDMTRRIFETGSIKNTSREEGLVKWEQGSERDKKGKETWDQLLHRKKRLKDRRQEYKKQSKWTRSTETKTSHFVRHIQKEKQVKWTLIERHLHFFLVSSHVDDLSHPSFRVISYFFYNFFHKTCLVASWHQCDFMGSKKERKRRKESQLDWKREKVLLLFFLWSDFISFFPCLVLFF